MLNLTEQDKQTLLAHARGALEYYFSENEILNDDAPDSRFMEKYGVFVSLRANEELRGCIGNIEPVFPMWDAISENAISAAVHDARFLQVTKEELKNISIEISILTPPQQCSLDEIKTGEDGVVLSQAGRKTTYLPQVWEQIKNRESFFSSLCEKAGLPSDCYNNNQTKFYKYQAIVFKEQPQSAT